MNLKKTLEPLLFFSIRVIEDLTRETATGEKEILTNQPQTKGLTLENWDASKAIFLEQRLNIYSDGYTRAEKINKELKRIDEMQFDPTQYRTDYEVIKQRYKEYLLNLPDEQPNKPQTKTVPSTFEELFFVASNAEQCLQLLKEIEPAVITDINHYIGSNKGIFPILMKELERTGFIQPQKPVVYKDLLNQRITGLNLSKDASEWRKVYKRLETDKTALSIKALISQYSQSGKLGK
jgi:hypothetical protein